MAVIMGAHCLQIPRRQSRAFPGQGTAAWCLQDASRGLWEQARACVGEAREAVGASLLRPHSPATTFCADSLSQRF